MPLTAPQLGIVLDGEVLPGTDWVLRDQRAWFAPDDADAPPRKHWPIRKLVFHWTGGTCREGPDTALRVVTAMKARERVDGTPMSVSCHFVVSWDGLVFQVCDLGRMAIHAGRVFNRDSIGVEQCWPGFTSQARKLGYDSDPIIPRTVGSSRVNVQKPSEKMIAASVRLAETLTSVLTPKIMIPKLTQPNTARLSPVRAARAQGVLEHAHSPGSEKLDCAGLVGDALRTRPGWA